jgi:hypothetical protein
MMRCKFFGFQHFLRLACDTCHNTPLFSDDEFHNLGLPPAPSDTGADHLARACRTDGVFNIPVVRLCVGVDTGAQGLILYCQGAGKCQHNPARDALAP